MLTLKITMREFDSDFGCFMPNQHIIIECSDVWIDGGCVSAGCGGDDFPICNINEIDQPGNFQMGVEVLNKEGVLVFSTDIDGDDDADS